MKKCWTKNETLRKPVCWLRGFNQGMRRISSRPSHSLPNCNEGLTRSAASCDAACHGPQSLGDPAWPCQVGKLPYRPSRIRRRIVSQRRFAKDTSRREAFLFRSRKKEAPLCLKRARAGRWVQLGLAAVRRNLCLMYRLCHLEFSCVLVSCWCF